MKVSLQLMVLGFAALATSAVLAQSGREDEEDQGLNPHALPEPDTGLSSAPPLSRFRAAIPAFEEADRDGNGLLSVEEARDAFPQPIVIVDADKDGVLSREEAAKAVPGLSFATEVSEAGENIGPQEYERIQQLLEKDAEKG